MTPDEAMVHDWFQRDPQFCIRSFDPTSQSQAQRNIVRGQDNTSASKTQNSTGTRCSPAKDAKMSLRMAAVKTLKLEVTGVTDTERLPRLAVAESPKQEVSKLPWLYIPRPPNNSPERPANPEFKVSRRRPGHRTIIPPSEDVKDLDLCRVFPRLN